MPRNPATTSIASSSGRRWRPTDPSREPTTHETGQIGAHRAVEVDEMAAQRDVGAESLEHQRVQRAQGARVALGLGADGVDEDEDAVAPGAADGAGQHVAVAPAGRDAVDQRRQQLVLRPEARGHEAAAVAGALPHGGEGHGLVAAFFDQLGGGVEEPGGRELGALLMPVPRRRHHARFLRMSSRTGSRRGMNASGFSAIGKCPTPYITSNVEPAMASWAACPCSMVALASYSPVSRWTPTSRGVDGGGLVGEIVIEEVEVEVAEERRRPARAVGPHGLPAQRLGRLRRHERVHQPGLVLVAHLRVPEPVEGVDVDVDLERRLEGDDGAEHVGVVAGEVEGEQPADRAAHEHRAVELERASPS